MEQTLHPRLLEHCDGPPVFSLRGFGQAVASPLSRRVGERWERGIEGVRVSPYSTYSPMGTFIVPRALALM